jgi:hypothetical protein
VSTAATAATLLQHATLLTQSTTYTITCKHKIVKSDVPYLSLTDQTGPALSNNSLFVYLLLLHKAATAAAAAATACAASTAAAAAATACEMVLKHPVMHKVYSSIVYMRIVS